MHPHTLSQVSSSSDSATPLSLTTKRLKKNLNEIIWQMPSTWRENAIKFWILQFPELGFGVSGLRFSEPDFEVQCLRFSEPDFRFSTMVFRARFHILIKVFQSPIFEKLMPKTAKMDKNCNIFVSKSRSWKEAAGRTISNLSGAGQLQTIVERSGSSDEVSAKGNWK